MRLSPYLVESRVTQMATPILDRAKAKATEKMNSGDKFAPSCWRVG